ncbi:L,D-transpeptidase family protein [Streptomyces sp. NPDC004284]|uniref:L,D-transpeptidase family protein n=1 Tax=Streptomyces sp. NPDC004284 TaxID=3364695 RepID=UPI0036797CBB
MNSNGQHWRGTMIAGALATALALAPATAARGTAPVAPPAGPTTLVFDKNPKKPTDSRLLVYKGKGKEQKLWSVFRAGSGTGVTDDCSHAQGWLPNGTWKIKLKSRTYNGRLVKGYAVYLENMPCSKNTLTRKEMFIHSEMNRDGTQGSTEARRWDGVRDYKSYGCVKLSPNDIKKMFRLFDRRDFGWPTHLRVVS